MRKMFSRLIFWFVSWISLLCDFHVSSCVYNCTEPPVFSPSRLVVKHGDPASANCSVCPACINSTFGLEKSVGDITEEGTMITWRVSSLTEWGLRLLCHYTDAATDDQCCSALPVVIYKAPDTVSFSVSNHTGPMLEHHQYTLLCTVHDVAPVQNLAVTFYRGKTPLNQSRSSSNADKPVTETFSLDITMRREDDGAQFWCKAELELGPEGPQRPPVAASQTVTANVQHKPQLEVSPPSINLSITEGDPLLLNCSAVGNPSPSYNWTLPVAQHPPPDGSILIQHVSSADGGRYTCTASNHLGEVHVTFDVEVRADHTPHIVAAVLIAVALLILCLIVAYCYYHKHTRTGQYNPKDVFHLQLIPTSIT